MSLGSLRLAGGCQALLSCHSSLCFLLSAASSASFPFGSPKIRCHEETEGVYISSPTSVRRSHVSQSVGLRLLMTMWDKLRYLRSDGLIEFVFKTYNQSLQTHHFHDIALNRNIRYELVERKILCE